MSDTLIQQQLSSKMSIRLIASIWTMDILHESASSLQKAEPIAAKWNKNEWLFAKWTCMFCRSGAAQYSHCDLRIALLVSYNLGIPTKFTNKLPKFAAKASKITNTFSMLAEWTLQSLGAALPATSSRQMPCTSSRQMPCTRVGAGRGRVPVRNCVLFLVSDVTARRQGPRQSESQGLREPGIRLPRRSQTGPDCPHEQLRFEVDVTEKEAEKKDWNGADRLPNDTASILILLPLSRLLRDPRLPFRTCSEQCEHSEWGKSYRVLGKSVWVLGKFAFSREICTCREICIL